MYDEYRHRLNRLPQRQREMFIVTFEKKKKSSGVAFLLCLLFGSFGFHKFYLRSPLALVYLFFCWTLIPTIFSLINLATIGRDVEELNHNIANQILYKLEQNKPIARTSVGLKILKLLFKRKPKKTRKFESATTRPILEIAKPLTESISLIAANENKFITMVDILPANDVILNSQPLNQIATEEELLITQTPAVQKDLFIEASAVASTMPPIYSLVGNNTTINWSTHNTSKYIGYTSALSIANNGSVSVSYAVTNNNSYPQEQNKQQTATSFIENSRTTSTSNDSFVSPTVNLFYMYLLLHEMFNKNNGPRN